MQINQFKALGMTQRTSGSPRTENNSDTGPCDNVRLSNEAGHWGGMVGAYTLFGAMPGGGPPPFGVEAMLGRMTGVGLCSNPVAHDPSSGHELKSELVKDPSTGRDRCLVVNPHGVLTEFDPGDLDFRS